MDARPPVDVEVQVRRRPGGGRWRPGEVAAPGPTGSWSVAHSADLALVATRSGGGRIGVDVERPRAGFDLARLAGRFAPGTAAAVAALPPEARAAAVLAAWVRAEAVLKALGVGLSRGLGVVEVGIGEGAEVRWVDPSLGVPAAALALADVPVPRAGWRAAVAVEGTLGTVRVVDRPPGWGAIHRS